LSPWSPEVRDRLALQLWARGARQEGAAELEESMFRFPSLSSHAYLGPAAERERHGIPDDGLSGQMAALDDEMAEAIGRGLDRALESAAGGERMAIVEDLATLLEARGHWREAAAALQAEAGRNAEVSGQLARAARDYLKADDKAAAEQVLRVALERAPERGDLYRTLAVDVYAARGDFPAAESVLQAGERNALDMLPVYEGVTEVLARRESMGVEKLASAEPPPRASGDAEVVP
jgi:tetratricopeptide (TPR) repeat protein